jgi:acetyl-CoA acetyltransferase
MLFKNAFVPYGAYWSTPFCKWQGSFADQNAVVFAGETAKKALADKQIPPNELGELFFGLTVPQHHSFYGGPWVAALLGAEKATGPVISQACATGAHVTALAALDVSAGSHNTVLGIAADRCSNGPHIYYPNPNGPGGTGDKEDWVLDNFGFDPWAKNSMTQTGENCATEAKVTREEQEEMTLIRFAQYQESLKNDGAFQKRYMITPLEVKDASGRKTIATVETDEGVFPTTPDGLKKLKPVMKDGTITFGCQTHPADGNCGIVVATKERAAALSKNKNIEIQIISYGEGRAKKGFMAMAIIPAAKRALELAGIKMSDVKTIKTHNPFAVNDVLFSREFNRPFDSFNNYGSSLIYGHPQAPTGMRLIIELIEELALLGGGYGLMDGCAAGDTGAAIVVKVNVR